MAKINWPRTKERENKAVKRSKAEKQKQHTSVTPLKRKSSGLAFASPIIVRYSIGSGFKRFNFRVFNAAQI